MRRFSQFLSTLLVFALACCLFGGCGGNNAQPPALSSSQQQQVSSTKTAENTPDDLKPATLIMYLIGDPAKNYDDVLAEFNKHAQADLNVTLEVVWVGWGDFDTKFPLVLSSGEPVDLIYTATWTDFYSLAQKGAFLPIEELGPTYAPESFRKQSKDAIEQATVNGHIYALAATYADYEQFGYIVRGDLMKKYGMTEIKAIDDYGEYLKNVARDDPEIDPAGFFGSENILDCIYLYNQSLYPASGAWDTNSPFWINVNTNEVVNFLEFPGILDYFEKMKELSDAGCWSKSVLSNKNNNMFLEDKSASAIHNLDTWTNVYMAHEGYDIKYYPCWPYSYIPNFMSNAMAVPSSSKNPERALMLLEKMRNEPIYYNLLTYGIEGVNFSLTDDNQLIATDPDIFMPEGYCSWGFKDVELVKPLVGSPPTIANIRKEIADSAISNPFTSFTPDIESVKSEFSAITNVMIQYEGPLSFGYVDNPEQGLQTLKDQLKKAGAEKVLAELQRQVNEYLNKR